jgi:hypothetical protein
MAESGGLGNDVPVAVERRAYGSPIGYCRMLDKIQPFQHETVCYRSVQAVRRLAGLRE